MPTTISAPPIQCQTLWVCAAMPNQPNWSMSSGQDVGGDEQAVERSRADLVDEGEAAEHGDGAREAAEGRPPRHVAEIAKSRQRRRHDEEQGRKGEDDQ